MLSIGIKKALNGSRIHLVTQTLLEFLVLRWSIESHTFVAKWGEFTPTLADLLNGFAFIRWGQWNRSDAGKGWQGQVAASGSGNASTKSSYSSWIRYFDKGEGSCSGLILNPCWLTSCLGSSSRVGRRMAWKITFFHWLFFLQKEIRWHRRQFTWGSYTHGWTSTWQHGVVIKSSRCPVMHWIHFFAIVSVGALRGSYTRACWVFCLSAWQDWGG